MHRLPQFFSVRNRRKAMDPTKIPGKPRLGRLNAAKNIHYDAPSSDDSSASLHTRSMPAPDPSSFRVEGLDGEVEQICQSLGLTGPEDFAIPREAWEEARRKGNTSSRLQRPLELELNKEREHQLCSRVQDSVRVSLLISPPRTEFLELHARRLATAAGCSPRAGINGARPPLLKSPPFATLPDVHNTCSNWDLLKTFAPLVDDENRDDLREPIEPRPSRIESCDSFSTLNDDDSSSTTTDPANISPNLRCKPIITSWEQGRRLGSGSFGSVYEAISQDGNFFAIKEVSLLDDDSQGRQSISQLQQEIALLSEFEHENIVQYYGTDTAPDGSKLYIFLELVSQGSLMSLYKRIHLMDSIVSAYTRQILFGLKYLHDQNVVHRDIKCANILVDVTGSVKLADFGLAKATKLNDVKSCKGTAFWMAPEVVNRKGLGYGLPADIWSLGCTVLEMLTRKLPYSEFESPMQALYKIGKGRPPEVPESLSEDARDFILQCLQVNPQGRPTAADLLNHSFVKKPDSGALSYNRPGRRI